MSWQALDALASPWPTGSFAAAARGRGRPHRDRARPARAPRADWRKAARRAQPQRPGRHRPAALPARPGPGLVAADLVDLIVAITDQAEAHVDSHRRPASPTCSTPSRCPSGTSWPSTRTRSAATSTGSPTGTGARRSPRWAPARWPAPPSSWTRRRWPPSWASPAPIANSIDAVSDRDFVAEFLFVAAMVGVHLSRLGRRSACGPRGSSAGPCSTTPGPPAPRSCRRRRTPTSPSSPGASPGG